MQSLVITKSGKELLSRIIAETTTMEFTRIATSDFDYSDTELEELTQLESVCQSALVSNVTRTDSTVVQVHGAMNNTEVTKGYYIRAVGLYAKDSDGIESLYAISIADIPDYMPAFGGKTVSGATFTLNTKVDNADHVSLVVDSGALVTVKQWEAVLEDLKEKPTLHTTPTLPKDLKGPYIWFQPVKLLPDGGWKPEAEEEEYDFAMELTEGECDLNVELGGDVYGVSNGVVTAGDVVEVVFEDV